jgi:hypothetical protein
MLQHPAAANWKMNAVSLLEHAQQRWLEGDSKAAELALHRMRQEIAQSGRIDLLARAELAACATASPVSIFALRRVRHPRSRCSCE